MQFPSCLSLHIYLSQANIIHQEYTKQSCNREAPYINKSPVKAVKTTKNKREVAVR